MGGALPTLYKRLLHPSSLLNVQSETCAGRTDPLVEEVAVDITAVMDRQ